MNKGPLATNTHRHRLFWRLTTEFNHKEATNHANDIELCKESTIAKATENKAPLVCEMLMHHSLLMDLLCETSWSFAG